jgi:hypothetical protein
MPVSKPLSSIRSLTTPERSALKKVGITDTTALLAAAKDGSAEKALAKKAGISASAVREAVNRADLLQVSGMSSTRADLFENAGVNSAAELAHRTASTLRTTLEKFAKAHPELDVHLPSPKTIASLITKAKELGSVTPPTRIDEARAREIAAAAMHTHIDQVLFGTDPAGADFREAILSWRPEAEWPKVREQMHADVANFAKTAELSTDEKIPGSYWFSGRLFQLYSEVKLDPAGKVLSTYVEID